MIKIIINDINIQRLLETSILQLCLYYDFFLLKLKILHLHIFIPKKWKSFWSKSKKYFNYYKRQKNNFEEFIENRILKIAPPFPFVIFVDGNHIVMIREITQMFSYSQHFKMQIRKLKKKVTKQQKLLAIGKN